MADELNTPEHIWHQRRYHIRLGKHEFSKKWIFADGVQRIKENVVKLDYYAERRAPTLVLDFENNFYAQRDVEIDDFLFRDDNGDFVNPTLIMDVENNFYATRTLDETDYAADDTSPTLVIDVENNFYTVEN